MNTMRFNVSLFFIGLSFSVFAQDILFANKNTFASQLNPALVSALSDFSISSVYRTQWTNYKQLGYDTYIAEINYAKGTVGSSFYIRTDKGLFNNYRNDIGLVLNNTVNRKKREIKYGLKLNYVRSALSGEEDAYRYNISNYSLHPKNTFGFRNISRTNSLNLGIGASLATNTTLLSFSIPQVQVLGPSDHIYLIPASLSFAYFKRLKDFSFSAQAALIDHFILSTDRQYMYSQLLTSIGINTKYKVFKIGAEYQLRTPSLETSLLNNIVYKAGFDKEKFSITYIFDNSNINGLEDEPNVALFSHEILAAWHINGRKQNSKTERILQSLF